MRIATLEGEDVDEDRPGIAEEHVERGCVFQDPAGGERLLAEIQRQLGRGEPLRRRPLPRVGRDANLRMAKAEASAGVVDFSADKITALLQGPAEGRIEEFQHGHARRSVHPPNYQVIFKAE